MENESIKRIKYYEALYNETREKTFALLDSLLELKEYEGKLEELGEYLESEERKLDLLAEERGEIPQDMPRAVLGEDYLWELVCAYDEIKSIIK